MVAVSVNQHELIADGAPTGLLFGTLGTGYLTLSHPSIEPGDGNVSEYARVREDGLQMGEDYDGGKSVAFEVQVIKDGATAAADAGDALDLFESTWRHPKWRNQFGAYAVLRSNMKGRTRRCYGRPRRFAATEDGLAKKGMVSFLCDFTSMDGRWYDDVPSSVITPVAGAAGGTRSATVTVGGTLDAWTVVTLSAGSADLVNPTIVLGPLSMHLPLTIAAGQTLTIDPRPWRRQFVWNNNPATPTGNVTPTGATALLRDWHLPQGLHIATLTADTLAANAQVRVEWANTWSRW